MRAAHRSGVPQHQLIALTLTAGYSLLIPPSILRCEETPRAGTTQPPPHDPARVRARTLGLSPGDATRLATLVDFLTKLNISIHVGLIAP
jgi:hypothetical protein